MNLIRGKQKPRSDLGFSLTSSFCSDGLSTECSRWTAKDTPCAGAAGVGEDAAGRAFDLFSSLVPGVSEPHPTSSETLPAGPCLRVQEADRPAHDQAGFLKEVPRAFGSRKCSTSPQRFLTK